MNNKEKELQGFEEGPDVEIYLDLFRARLKKSSELENSWPWQHNMDSDF